MLLKPRLIGMSWGAIVSLIPLCDFIARPPRQELAQYNFELVREAPPMLSAALGILLFANGLPAIVAAWQFGIDFRRSGYFPAIALANVITIGLSLLGVGPVALIYIATVSYCFVLANIISALAFNSNELMEGFFRAIAVGIAISIALMLVDGNYSYGRLMGRSGPNYWGMTALALWFSAFSFRTTAVKLSLASLALVTIYLCQSRGALIALCAGTTVMWLIVVYHANVPQRLAIISVSAIFAALALVVMGETIATKLLLVDSPGRGLSSGGTGRFAAWAQTFDLFSSSPWFGVGYRQHERYITAASSSHNAYLASLADTGVFGFITYLALMLGGTTSAIIKAISFPTRLRIAVAGLATCFLVIGLVERVAINTGNSLSVVMIFAMAWSFRSIKVIKTIRVPRTPRRPGAPGKVSIEADHP